VFRPLIQLTLAEKTQVGLYILLNESFVHITLHCHATQILGANFSFTKLRFSWSFIATPPLNVKILIIMKSV